MTTFINEKPAGCREASVEISTDAGIVNVCVPQAGVWRKSAQCLGRASLLLIRDFVVGSTAELGAEMT